MPMKPCLDCGAPAEGGRCDECRAQARREYERKRGRRGRDADYEQYWWRKLSRKARKLQPFCSDCGSTEDLQLDHSPETWQRIRDRKPVRLEHTGGVVCGPCNRTRGQARPGEGGSPGAQVRPGRQGITTITLENDLQLGGGES